MHRKHLTHLRVELSQTRYNSGQRLCRQGITAQPPSHQETKPMPYREASARLQALLQRQDRVLTVMHPPSAALAQVMEAAGAEVGFVGTSGVIGAYTGMEDVGTASLSECVMIGGWIARAVQFPVILDGDTDTGGLWRYVASSRTASKRTRWHPHRRSADRRQTRHRHGRDGSRGPRRGARTLSSGRGPESATSIPILW